MCRRLVHVCIYMCVQCEVDTNGNNENNLFSLSFENFLFLKKTVNHSQVLCVIKSVIL